ncbi:DUF2508 family protein [Paenibacillus sp. NFR01]|uniref:DUF2508 family protein n=1 Tax=Paenibacillus sp. NFR01 TaxID=1566279 RepID=UPI0008B76065|nr:DUF2508 family protein [Paenibacillus sp. NFR01]SEU31868.1 Protein of unknown function [Paenibacillus sp. NFR01]
MAWWQFWRPEGNQEHEAAAGGSDEWNAFLEVRKAQMEWERAHLMFDEAVGQDQIDYAIYILEAAERKYQIHLKHAKNLGLDRSQIGPRY